MHHKTLNSLLNPLGIKTIRLKLDAINSNFIRLYPIDFIDTDHFFYLMHDADGYGWMNCKYYYNWACFDMLWKSMISSALFVDADTMHYALVTGGNIYDYKQKNIITNPYLGCKSLEEAKIKRDLMLA